MCLLFILSVNNKCYTERVYKLHDSLQSNSYTYKYEYSTPPSLVSPPTISFHWRAGKN